MSKSHPEVALERPAFDAIVTLAHREFGLNIAPEKLKMVQSRLRHRLRALNLTDFDSYSDLVRSTDGADERRSMISALTTNVSHFFREPHHFDTLNTVVLPRIRERMKSKDRIRIWSAGCSNGQEPYSIAMYLLHAEPYLKDRDFKILATDIDPKVVAFAERGLYSREQTEVISSEYKSKFMSGSQDALGFTAHLRSLVTFRELNLLAPWPMKYPFDAIFCRNVVIYFDLPTQEALWPRFHASLRNDGVFFLGHSERIAAPANFGFKTIGTTTYKKTAL